MVRVCAYLCQREEEGQDVFLVGDLILVEPLEEGFQEALLVGQVAHDEDAALQLELDALQGPHALVGVG